MVEASEEEENSNVNDVEFKKFNLRHDFSCYVPDMKVLFRESDILIYLISLDCRFW